MTTKAEQLGQSVVAAARDFVSRSLESRDTRIAELERRLTEIETTQQSHTLADSYKGSYSPNTLYERGAWVSHRGATWLCMKSTSEPPGSTGDWRLILKGAR
jgi:hypothetical protein